MSTPRHEDNCGFCKGEGVAAPLEPRRGPSGHFAEHLSTHTNPPETCATCWGVAAPLEPTPLEFWKSWDISWNRLVKDGVSTDYMLRFGEVYAAAVSKNLTDKYAEMEAKWMRELLTVSNEIGEARDLISDLLNHDGGPGSIDYDAAKVFRARAKLLEFREITALRETK